MANELNIQLDPFLETGLALTGSVYSKTGTQQGTNVSMSESSTGFYTGDFSVSGLSDGDYGVKFQTATEFYGSGVLKVKDGAEFEPSDSTTATAIKERTDNLPDDPASNSKVEESAFL